MQQTLADNGFERFRKQTRREMFLLEMDQIIPWLCKVIKPFYPKRQGAGRPPVGLERIAYSFSEHWFNLSDPLKRRCIRVPCAALLASIWVASRQPDETTVCKFRHLRRQFLGGQLFNLVNEYLEENGLKVSTGTIVDATIIRANLDQKQRWQRDPEITRRRKATNGTLA